MPRSASLAFPCLPASCNDAVRAFAPAGSVMPRRWRAALAVTAWALATNASAGEPVRVETLTTPGYVVRIEVGCAEGEVSCDKVRYEGTDRRSGASITLRGRTLHTTCADGVTPCRFLGYVFKRGGVSYTVLESGALVVRRGGRTLLEEAGRWE